MLKMLLGAHLYMKVDRLGTYAASLAYCFVLSLVPFLAVTFVVGATISSKLSLTNYSNQYGKVVSDILPTTDNSKQILKAIQSQYDLQDKDKDKDKEKKDRPSGWLIAVGFLVAIYTSYTLMDQMQRTILFIFDDPRRPQKWNWRILAKAFLLLLIWMCLLLLISMSAAEAAVLSGFLATHTSFSKVGQIAISFGQIVFVIAALFGTFYLTYYLVPAKSHNKRYVVEGSLLASTGWILCSLAFASIMPTILRTSAAYIALGSVVAILLWAQACAWSIILGACWIVRFSNPK